MKKNTPFPAQPARSARPPVEVAADAPGSANGQGVALSLQLQHVSHALQDIRSGRSGSVVLEAVPLALRPGVQALLFQVLRTLGWAEAVRRQLAPRTPRPPVDALLCTALALLADAEHLPYEPFTLVNQTVEATKQDSSACKKTIRSIGSRSSRPTTRRPLWCCVLTSKKAL